MPGLTRWRRYAAVGAPTGRHAGRKDAAQAGVAAGARGTGGVFFGLAWGARVDA